jgi:hypothetical protein
MFCFGTFDPWTSYSRKAKVNHHPPMSLLVVLPMKWVAFFHPILHLVLNNLVYHIQSFLVANL